MLADFECESINIGAAGIIIGLMSIDCATGSSQFTRDIESGCYWLASRVGTDKASGLFTGNAGVALALAIAAKRFNRPEWLRAAKDRLIAATDGTQCDLFAGRAGLVWSACLISDIVEEDWPLDIALNDANYLIRNVKQVNDVCIWDSIGGNDDYLLGAAHGAAGIAMAIGAWGLRTGCDAAVELSKDAFRRLYRYSLHQGASGLPRSIGESPCVTASNDIWCHGTGGYLWSMLQVYPNASDLEDEVNWAATRFLSESTINNPTYCHGLSGQLELCRMLARLPHHQIRAERKSHFLASALMLMRTAGQKCRLWPAEDGSVLTPDLWVGYLGPATALALYASQNSCAILSSDWLKFCAGDTNAT